MTRKIASILALLVLIGSSFAFGVFTKDYIDNTGILGIPTYGEADETFLEVLNQLMDYHYTLPSEEDLYQGAIDGMINSLDDPFTTYFDFEEYVNYQSNFGESYVGIGVTVRFSNELIVVEAVKEDGPADQAGIRVNDIIAFVDYEDIRDLPYYETVGMIVGEEGTDVTVGVIRQGVEDVIHLTMTRAVIENATVEAQTYVSGDKTIGYIKVSSFGDQTAALFANSILQLEGEGIDGLVVDLRNNGGGHLGTVLSMLRQFLLNDGVPMFYTETYFNGETDRNNYYGVLEEAKPYQIVTLVNENSASASEVFASAMKEHGGYPVIGTTTYGKGTMQTDISITTTTEDSLHITIGKWFTSDGNWVHFDGGTNGVLPTLQVERTKYEDAYKVFLLDQEIIEYDTVDSRVANIQLILTTMGYTVREDGYFDTATRDAILDIQQTNGLTETGNIDADTLTIINAALDEYQDNFLNDTQLVSSISYLVTLDE